MKYFVVSDIHSHYKELSEALNMSGYDINNENHTLIVLGDVFDRGCETKKVYKFLKSIPEDRLILIKGNHEELYLELLEKDFPDRSDFSNGTVKAFCEIAGFKRNRLDHFSVLAEASVNWNAIKEKVKRSQITKWIKSDKWLDFYEVGNFILTHSFIPCVNNSGRFNYNQATWEYKEFWHYNPNWRTVAPEEVWSEARWGCPYKQYDAGLFEEEIKKGKTLVCGHWKCSDFHEHYYPWKDIDDADDIFYSKHLIALDATTILSKQVNVLVIDENFKCYNQYGKELN